VLRGAGEVLSTRQIARHVRALTEADIGDNAIVSALHRAEMAGAVEQLPGEPTAPTGPPAGGPPPRRRPGSPAPDQGPVAPLVPVARAGQPVPVRAAGLSAPPTTAPPTAPPTTA
jgi:hypothetical protein